MSSRKRRSSNLGEAPTGGATIKLAQLYSLRDAHEVGRFVHRHPFLLPLLMEARERVRRYFPAEDVALEVISDPEEPGFEELFAFIITDLGPDEALLRLRRLDDEWWLEEMPRAEGKLCIHLRCK